MRLLLLAAVTGVAISAALLGLSLPNADGAGQFRGATVPYTSVARVNVVPDESDPIGPASHEDGNRARTDYLNQNVIDGITTTVCAADTAMYAALEPAIQAWNDALPNIAGGSALTRHAPTTITQQAPDPLTGLPRTTSVTECRGMNVEVLWLTDQTQTSQCSMNGWGAPACYDSKKVSSPLPRRLFESSDNADPGTGAQNYAIIYYQRTTISQSTLVHELGHVLGLGDYFTCDELREGPDPTTGLDQPNDVDPRDDHFSTMSYGACRAKGVITGRDLRDLYEEYRVGAVTNVRLDSSASETGPGTTRSLSFTLWWGADGIAEANHNASHIAVLRQPSGSTSWMQVGTAVLIRDSSRQPVRYINNHDDRGVAAIYKVVGLTRGDIRRQGDFDVTRSFRIPGATAGTTTTATFVEGDPTYVKGVAAYTENGTQIEVSGPNVLSASVSPRYCYANNTLAVSMHSSGGSSTATESVTDAANNAAANSASVPCGTVTGQRSFTAKAVWGSGATKVTRTISLPVNVHARPVRVNSVSATIDVPNPTETPGTPLVSRTITSCAKGEQVTLLVSTGSPRPAIELWANGAKLPSSVFTCPDVTGPIQILALRSDGGGRQLSLGVIEPLTITRVATQRECVAGGTNLKTYFGFSGGQKPYSYVDSEQRRTRSAASLFGVPFKYDCGTTVGTSTRTITVVDANDRRTSQTFNLATLAPTPTVTVPPTPTGLSASATSTSLTLTWSTADRATSYDVMRSGAPTPINVPSGRSYTFPNLTANTPYTLYVRARNSAGPSGWSPPYAARTSAAPAATKPAAPTGLQASTSVTANAATATLTWTAPAGVSNVSYGLWRSGATSNSSTTNTTYTFGNLDPYETYNLYVWTLNAAGVRSTKVSTPVTLPARPGVLRTAAPTRLQTSNITNTSATLSWNVVPGATRYRVWRSNGSSVTLPSTARSYTFTDLLPSRGYSLMVWAFGNGGISPFARVVIETSGPKPATPTGLRTSTGLMPATTPPTATQATATRLLNRDKLCMADKLDKLEQFLYDRAMDPLNSPYAPGAGAPPPELAGREAVLDATQLALSRRVHGRASKSVVLIGLRGVGKTVLLERMRNDAEDDGITAVAMESPEDRSLPSSLAPALRQALFDLSRRSAAKDLAARAMRGLASFVSAMKVKYDDIEISLDVAREPGVADLGDLEMDLTELLQLVGRAAQEAQTAVAFFVDELQYVDEQELAALITALHRIAQRQLPVTMVGAGLPQLRGQMGRAKSYAERLFDIEEIGPLSPADARAAIAKPAAAEGVRFQDDALDEIVRQTQGYPYFLQEWGTHVWEEASRSPITLSDVRAASARTIGDLDRSFFRVRFDRLTRAELNYARAMAELGAGPYRSGEIAGVLGREVTTVAPVRNRLINKGMVWSPSHGVTAFTVPLFDEFMKRTMPEWE